MGLRLNVRVVLCPPAGSVCSGGPGEDQGGAEDRRDARARSPRRRRRARARRAGREPRRGQRRAVQRGRLPAGPPQRRGPRHRSAEEREGQEAAAGEKRRRKDSEVVSKEGDVSLRDPKVCLKPLSTLGLEYISVKLLQSNKKNPAY